MVKRKVKNIKEIQAALLTNTHILGKEQLSEEDRGHVSIVDLDVMMKYEALAAYDKVDVGELINKALNHYLKLKGLQLEQALNAQKNK